MKSWMHVASGRISVPLSQHKLHTATPPRCNPSGTHDYLAQHTIGPWLSSPVITCHHLSADMSSIMRRCAMCRQDTLELPETRPCIQTNRTDLGFPGLPGLLRDPQRLEDQFQIPHDLLAAHLGGATKHSIDPRSIFDNL